MASSINHIVQVGLHSLLARQVLSMTNKYDAPAIGAFIFAHICCGIILYVASIHDANAMNLDTVTFMPMKQRTSMSHLF